MSRPGPEIIETTEDAEGRTWELYETEGSYMITYEGRAVGLRSLRTNMVGQVIKYRKMMYNNEGNAKLEVKRLNRLFNTTSFSYVVL